MRQGGAFFLRRGASAAAGFGRAINSPFAAASRLGPARDSPVEKAGMEIL
jgi:hypothetical protein